MRRYCIALSIFSLECFGHVVTVLCEIGASSLSPWLCRSSMQHVAHIMRAGKSWENKRVTCFWWYCVLRETNGSPQFQPVYYLLTLLGCSMIIFLCGMQAWPTDRQSVKLSPEKAPSGKLFCPSLKPISVFGLTCIQGNWCCIWDLGYVYYPSLYSLEKL